MEAGILQITVLKGPKNGEILVCKPGSKVRIGRVIKGNNFAVRDPGISQKHLCFQFVPESSRWFVSDLDSCNGTILNGFKIQALVLVPISNSDVIKIGDKTELGVKIVSSVLLEENEEENGDVKGTRVDTRRGLARGCTRAGSSRGSQEEDAKEEKSRVSVPVKGGRNNAQANPARASNKEEKMEGNGNSVLFSSVQIEEPDQSIGVKLRRNPRRGNSSRALKEVDLNCAVGIGTKAKGVRMKREERKGKKTGVSDDEMCNRIDELLPEPENENGDSDYVIIMDEGKGFKVKTTVNSSMVTEEEKGDGNIGLKEGLELNCEVGDQFEKMTQEQWFDSMELFLPKAIHDESEKIINILKEKARKFEEFIEAGGDV